tara:strand:+ start:714 stop:1487 length:774 start_codon:yes stop_codon:yes gene_type:complete
MTDFEKEGYIELLRDDNHYYGELGKEFISNSDINTLVSDPDLYGKGLDDGINLIKGSYMHLRILEPEKVKDFQVVDAATRRNKEYTEYVKEHTIEGQPKPIFMLKKEATELEMLARRIETNNEFVDALQTDIQPNEIEEPAIGELFGYQFKGKADRINRRRGFIADLKTTRSLSLFRGNAESYGYHTQAYIYQQLFGLPVRFYVIGKEDGRLGVYDVSEDMLKRAEERVKWGLERLEMYYGSNPDKEIDQYYEYMLL